MTAKQLIEERLAVHRPGQSHQGAAPAPLSMADEIAKLATLRDSGAISDEEFTTLKQQLLERD